MAREVFFDTSGFFALMDERDAFHQKALRWIRLHRTKTRPVTTEWVIGETCTLLVARQRPHMVGKFLDYLNNSAALLTVNPEDALLASAKAMIRRQAEQGYSFVDCVSFCVMTERQIRDALTTDAHFRKAGFSPQLA
jgi:predicted nucleic acid-binding protein